MFDVYIWLSAWVGILIMLIIGLAKIESRIAEDRINKMFEYLKERKGEKMARYIDADALLRNTIYNAKHVPYITKSDVAEAQTADMVEIITSELTKKISERLIQVLEENYEIIPKKPVVRCKECRYFDNSDKYCCDFLTADEDGFCAWGERRNDG